MRRGRPAFTLFQLLVVLAVLLILLALLLPAVQKVRIAAARTTSQGHLKQIALAAHNYHDTQAALPAGCDARHFAAAAHLLPYIEQANLHRTIDFTRDSADKANATAARTAIKLFLSPLDPLEAGSLGGTNYLFNAGSKASLEDNNGVFYAGSKLTLAAISAADGTSNTLLAAETTRGDGSKTAVDVRRQHVRLKKAALAGLRPDAGVKEWKAGTGIAADRGGAWIDGRFLQGTFNSGRRINDPRPDVDCAGAGGLSGLRNFEYGTNIAFCDGSVRWLSQSVTPKVLEALSTRNGGEAFQLD